MITITQLNKIGEDERGATHYFNTERTGEFIVAYRKAGSISGRHYHKGIAKQKNPEKIIIMEGIASLNWFEVNGTRKGVEKLNAPALVEIEPWAWHEVIAETDMIVLELNGLNDAKDDTFRVD